MKFIKSLIAFTLFATLMLTVGCGGKVTDPTASGESTPTSNPTPSEEVKKGEAVLTVNVTPVTTEKFKSDRPYDSSKEDVSIILVVGQSNFTTSVGYVAELDALELGKTNVPPEAPTQVNPKTAYSCHPHSPLTELGDANDLNKLSNPQNGAATIGGVTPSFGAEWSALTNTKTVFIQAAVGAVGVHEWTPNPNDYVCTCTNNGKGQLYKNAVNAYNTVFDALSKNYNIVYTGYIWNQGEHDEVYGDIEGNTVVTADAYYKAYKSMHDGFMKDLKLDFGGISVVRADKAGKTAEASSSITIARAAQYKLCNDINNLYMISTLSETCSSEVMDQGNTIHYSQAVFNIMGAEAARNLYANLGLNTTPAEFNGVTVLAQKGKTLATISTDGSITSGSAELTLETAGKQIIIKPSSLGTNYMLSYTLTVDTEDCSQYIDEYLKIDWDALSAQKKLNKITLKYKQ